MSQAVASRRRIVILSAGVGAGHDGPAYELARRAEAAGHAVQVVDLVALAPLRLGSLFCRLFHAQLRWAPTSWGRWFRAMDESIGLPWLARRLIRLVTRRVGRILQDMDGRGPADVVVGTFPAAGHVLNQARKFGVTTPSVLYLTDPAVHRLWIADNTDLYLTTWHGSADQIRAFTDAPVVMVAPAVRTEFTDARVVTDARRLLGLPPGPLALLASGSWGVGDVRHAAVDLLQCSRYTPVVACGQNAGLRRQLERVPGVVALGWVSDMAGLMRICDVAILNSGGLTLAESAVCGLPVVHYRPLPGQGTANAEFCELTGYAPWASNLGELEAAIRAAGAAELPPLSDTDPLDPILALASGVLASDLQTLPHAA